jgi:hypothetical protein
MLVYAHGLGCIVELPFCRHKVNLVDYFGTTETFEDISYGVSFGQVRFDGGVRALWSYPTPSSGIRANITTLPQFGVCFLAASGTLLEGTADFGVVSFSAAEVESDAALVGTNAPYDPNLVAQLRIPPEAYYITSYNGVLFAARIAGISGGDSLVRWSGAGQASVWPEENFADLAEDDNSQLQAHFAQ